MARLDTGATDSRTAITIPWKVVFLLLFVLGTWGYIWYQYVRFHPRPPTASPAQAKMENKIPAPMREAQELANLVGLTNEQKERLLELAVETTSPAQLRKQAWKILTPEQRAKVLAHRKELAAKRKELEEKRQQRLKKYFGDELQYAQQANKVIREQREARRKQLEAQKQAQQSPVTASNPSAQASSAGGLR